MAGGERRHGLLIWADGRPAAAVGALSWRVTVPPRGEWAISIEAVPIADGIPMVLHHPRGAGRLWCSPAIPCRYLPLRAGGLRLGNSRLAIDIRPDGWDLAGPGGTHTELVNEPRDRSTRTRT